MGEPLGVDVIVGRLAAGDPLELVDEAQPHEVLVGVGDFAHFVGPVEGALAGGTEALDGVGFGEAQLERV